MRKIYFLVQQLNAGGVEKAICLLANSFSNKKFDVEIISLLKSDAILQLNDNIKITYLTFFKSDKDIKKSKIYKLRRKIVSFYKLIKIIKKIEDSIIISSRNEYSTLLSKYGNNSQLRIAQLHHDHLFNKKLLCDFKYKYQNIDYFVHLTDISKNEIEKLVRPYNQRTKFITIPNYVMPYNCEDYKRNNYVISVGRFSHEKGFLRLLDVWAKVVNKNKEWKLLLIGDGPEMNFIKEKMLKLNISEYVECPGFLDNKEVMRLLNKSKIYAMPSYTEAFPFTLVEAMQNKLPAVSFDVRIGPQVLIDNDKNGFLVEDDNVDLFAEKLLTLMDNPLLLNEFSNKAFEKSEDFLEENVIKKWIDILL